MTPRNFGLGLSAFFLTLPAAYAAEVPINKMPVNEWVKVTKKADRGYVYARPVFVAARGQVLQWGLPYEMAYNEVIAFDPAARRWIADHPAAPEQELPRRYRDEGGAGGLPTFEEKLTSGGAPVPWAVSNGACYVPRRREIIYGGLYGYHVETRAWRMLEPTWVLGDRKYRELLPCAALSYCYDPVNDQLVAFPHHGILGTFETFDLMGGPQMERLPGGHRVLGHYGTLVYRFDENTWRQVGRKMGSEQARRARSKLTPLAAEVSRQSDHAYCLRRERRGEKPGPVASKLNGLAAAAKRIVVFEGAQAEVGKLGALLEKAAAAAEARNWGAVVKDCGEALWHIDALLDGNLRTEPPARTGTPMVYDPKNRCIVMFGGHSGICRYDLHRPVHYGDQPGALSCTWIYDCKTQQWREVSSTHGPPAELWPKMVYDPASELVLLVGREAIWGLDAAQGTWHLLHEPAWDAEVPQARGYALRHHVEEVCLDPDRELLMLIQPHASTGSHWDGTETFLMHLDVGKMKPRTASGQQKPPPVRPQVMPPDDPQWMKKLQTLTANTWVDSDAENKPPRKGYTSAACDPVRGDVYFFGGGHGDYQINDVQVYQVGANRWVYAAGDNNDWVPPTGWDGWCMGIHGGPNAGHQRNYYCAVDGRMFKSVGTCSARWPNPEMKKAGAARFAYFYDIDRHGVWRTVEIDRVERGPDVSGTWGWPHMATPDGRVIGFGGRMEPYNGRFSSKTNFFSYDIYGNHLTVRNIPPPFPSATRECRPFCFVPDKAERGQVLVVESAEKPRTWLYDIADNVFTDVQAANQPKGDPRTVLYIEEQNAAFAVIDDKQWVYSFEKNAWGPLPLRGQDGHEVEFSRPYAQTVFSARYGVLVNLPRTELLRPDFSEVKFE
ncbi:MAG: hypothetical protein ACQESR_07615 [Planctomycetota bacterium]